MTKFLWGTIWIFQRKSKKFWQNSYEVSYEFSTKIRKFWQNSYGVPYVFFNENQKIWKKSYGVKLPYEFFPWNFENLKKAIWGTIWIFPMKFSYFEKSYGVPYELSMKLGNFPQTCILVYLLLIHIRKFSNKMKIFAKYPPWNFPKCWLRGGEVFSCKRVDISTVSKTALFEKF